VLPKPTIVNCTRVHPLSSGTATGAPLSCFLVNNVTTIAYYAFDACAAMKTNNVTQRSRLAWITNYVIYEFLKTFVSTTVCVCVCVQKLIVQGQPLIGMYLPTNPSSGFSGYVWLPSMFRLVVGLGWPAYNTNNATLPSLPATSVYAPVNSFTQNLGVFAPESIYRFGVNNSGTNVGKYQAD
jgi:hypothetical protein